MEDIFDTNFEMEEYPQPPKMTKDEFIEKTRSMLQLILDEYGRNFKNKYNEDDEENEENACSTCNGFLYIEQGGVGDVDCPNCNGTGLNHECVFDTENFMDFIEFDVLFGKQPFLELLHCVIIDTGQNGSTIM